MVRWGMSPTVSFGALTCFAVACALAAALAPTPERDVTGRAVIGCVSVIVAGFWTSLPLAALGLPSAASVAFAAAVAALALLTWRSRRPQLPRVDWDAFERDLQAYAAEHSR